MFFINFIVEHWILSLVVYVLVSFRFVLEYHRYVMRENGIQDRYYRRRPILRRVLPKIHFVFAFTFVPLLMLVLKPLDIRERRRRDERNKIAAERERQYLEERERSKRIIEAENRIRADARKDYFAYNPPKLYYNTVDGITVVMKPADYEHCKSETVRYLCDQRWTKDSVLMPSQRAYLFLQQSGLELFSKNFNTSEALGWTCGWLSRLHEVAKKKRCSARAETRHLRSVCERGRPTLP